MGDNEKLHLANSLETLDLLAKKDFDPKRLKFQQICNALNKVYKTSQNCVLDQEKTYILLVRYINLYNHLLKTQPDKKFVSVRFGSEYEKVLAQFEEMKKSLAGRYIVKAATVPDKFRIEENEKEVQNEIKPQRVFSGEFITCEQLFSALQECYNVLLVDARPDTDFAESRIDHKNCINIPDQCITPGLSAHTLGKKLPEKSQQMWELREKYDVIILYDWNTSSDNIGVTKLNKLRSALVDWDFNRNYNEPPVILSGGYLELLQMYPTVCINPHVYLFQKDNELDELLELDNITYPTESDNKTLVMGKLDETQLAIETQPSDEDEDVTKDSLSQESKEITIKRQHIITRLQDAEEEKKNINDLYNQENNINNIADMNKRVIEINEKISQFQTVLEDLDEKRDDVKKRFRSNFQEEIEDGSVAEDSKDTTKIEGDSEKLKDIIDEQRNKELKRARALKPKQDVNINNSVPTEAPKPLINRATKPAMLSITAYKVDSVKYVTFGLVGLRNIRNTCYMNTAIQCLRNIPMVMELFCKGTYSQYNIRNPAAIIHETAGLIRMMWSTNLDSVEPTAFYTKMCQLESIYKLGNHEDSMEFFLCLLNHLSEDCCYEISLPNIMTPKQRAWYNQFEGKNSVFIDMFYHQIRITQTCVQCEQKTIKFEIENSFMLSVPDYDFSLDELMKDYMADYTITDYCCSKCNKAVNNKKEICYEPKVVTIVLKRYRQFSATGGKVSLKKISSRVNFRTRNFRVGNALYQLNAVALHSGDLNFGHYTAAAITPDGWYEFNDLDVRPININDESFKYKACAFFYSICDDKENLNL